MVGPGPGCVAGHCWGLVVAIHHGHRRSRCHRRRSCRHYRHRKPWLAIASHGWTTAIAVCRFSPRQWVRGVVGRGGCTRGILAAPPPPPHSRCRHRRSRSCSLLERMLAIAVIGPGWLAGPGPCWLAGPGPCCLAGHGWLAGPGWLRAKPLLLDRRTRGLAGSSSSSSPSSSPPSLFMDPCTKANFTTVNCYAINCLLVGCAVVRPPG